MTDTTDIRRGRLKIYLGYAAGVGKTFQMLDEAHEVTRQGRKVVVGYLEPHGRADIVAKAEGLPAIRRRTVDYRGMTLEEMDTDGVLRRQPELCLVDEFPHTNVAGSRHAKRWQDVLDVLDAGIDVWTTMNIQHLESLNDQVAQITGVRVRETIPDWVVAQADEVVMVDLTPHALLNRLRRGVVYAPQQAEQALQHFFKESTLVALRELALRQTAHEIETRDGDADSGPEAGEEGTRGDRPPVERLLLNVTADPATAILIRRGRRMADFLRADCFAVYVQQGSASPDPTDPRRKQVDRHLEFARRLHIETRVLHGQDVAAALVDFARIHEATQVLLLRPSARRWPLLPARQLVYKVVRRARDLQVVIVAARLGVPT